MSERCPKASVWGPASPPGARYHFYGCGGGGGGAEEDRMHRLRDVLWYT